MKKIRLILLAAICSLVFYHTAFSMTKDTVMMDSTTKIKLDKKLIKMAKEVVLKHGPGYYREYKEPIIKYERVSDSTRDLFTSQKLENMGRIYYTVEYPYNEKEELFNNGYSAIVYFWEDLTIFNVLFGHNVGIPNYDKLSKAEKKKWFFPFTRWKPRIWVKDTIKDEKGNIIDIWNRCREVDKKP